MKKLIMMLALLLAVATAGAKEIKTIVYTVDPQMVCGNCENKIKGNLRFEKGVKDITTSLEEQTVTIVYDADKTTPERIEKAFGKIGYTVSESCPRQKSNCDNAKGCTPQKSGCGNADACPRQKEGTCSGK